MPKDFQHSKATHGYFSVWTPNNLLRSFFFFYQETGRFLPIIGDEFCQSDWNWHVWLRTRKRTILSALAQIDVESERRFQHLTNAFGGIWVRLELSEPLWWRSNHRRHNNMKIVTAYEHAPRLREVTRTWLAKQEAGARFGKEVRALRFSLPHCFEFACHSSRPSLLFTHFNQLLKINNIALFTRAWLKKILTYAWYNDAQVNTPIASCYSLFFPPLASHKISRVRVRLAWLMKRLLCRLRAAQTTRLGQIRNGVPFPRHFHPRRPRGR